MSQIEPNLGKVVVKVEVESERTSGGLYIPGSVVSDGVKKATVVVVGPLRKVDGELTALLLKEGDRVLVDPLGATKMKVDGVEMLLMRVEDILARIS